MLLLHYETKGDDFIVKKSIVIIVSLLIINLIIALVFIIAGIFMPKGKKASAILLGIFYIVCPIVGPSCYFIYWLLLVVFYTSKFDSESLTFSTDRTESVLASDEHTELNYISIQDALVMNDTSSLRRLLLNVLKERSVIQAPSITKAISSSDAESSHYAATAVTNYLSEFQSVVQTKLYRIKQMPNNVPTIIDAINYILPVLQANIMDDIEQRSYVYILDDMMDDMYQNNKWHLSSKNYLDITDLLLNIKDYSRARTWVNRANECRSGELNTYKCSIHLFYTIQSIDELFAVVDDIKKSNIVIDKEMLDFIRILS